MAGQAELDAAAQQMGFRNYAQWAAYQAAQQRMHGPAIVGQGTTGQPPARPQPRQAPQQPQRNWLQQLIWGLGGAK